ncbi:hypothetical protein BKA63DRAFT_176145 [Paraphoma chrysanthemicola]|nr:hypothetical protein BKA63DRAFT_176145 [Paraphoma chrysanthemicola]
MPCCVGSPYEPESDARPDLPRTQRLSQGSRAASGTHIPQSGRGTNKVGIQSSSSVLPSLFTVFYMRLPRLFKIWLRSRRSDRNMVRCAVEGCKVAVPVCDSFQGHGGWLCTPHVHEMRLSVLNLARKQYDNGDWRRSESPVSPQSPAEPKEYCDEGKVDTPTKAKNMEGTSCNAAATGTPGCIKVPASRMAPSEVTMMRH